MKYFIMFFVLISINLSFAFADSDDILTGDIILTHENIREAFKIPTPDWIKVFDNEITVNHYTYGSTQPSLATLRASKIGNCMAFAKLGAWHASRAGYKCKLICLVRGGEGHMFLYASKNDSHWAVSNMSRKYVDSIKDAIVKMNAIGSQIVSEMDVDFSDTDGDTNSIPTSEVPMRSIEPENNLNDYILESR